MRHRLRAASRSVTCERVPIIGSVLVSDFNYDLPEELIAQQPLADRAGSRLLLLERRSGRWRDEHFRNFAELLRADDLLVLNNTRVFPARLYGWRAGLKSQPLSARNRASRNFLHGRIEVLLTRQSGGEASEWECLVRPGRKIGVGERLYFGRRDQQVPELRAEVVARGAFGERRIRFEPVEDFLGTIEAIGHVPLPPYISRSDTASDRERYQTVYAKESGSVAAPTAGLHFTPEILERIRGRGTETVEITLHVGLGTFQPVRVEEVEEHRLHSERYCINAEAADRINRAVRERRRVIAVGTTTVRTLEYAGQQGEGTILAGPGEADLFIYPGYEFRVVSAMLTNFHLPRSTLLMMVCAFGGKETVLRAYEHAAAQGYRFYSYGDCMFLE
jgi:S-adenosylmethionine:tRNA ribosyltransferase-isomerase